MKRSDVQAGTIYAVKPGYGSSEAILVLSTETLWHQEGWDRWDQEGWDRWGRKNIPARPLRDGEKSDARTGFPAAKRAVPTLPHPDGPGWGRIPDPDDRWDWEPAVVIPRDLIAPLDEHERQQQDEAARRKAAEEERARTITDRCRRAAALLDVLPLDHGQQAALGSLRWNSDTPEKAEVSLEWLEGIAALLREAGVSVVSAEG